MYSGSLVFTQIMQHLPWDRFRRCVSRYGGDRYVKAFSCADRYRCMAFAQLTYRTSLRDIEACLRAQSGKLYHMGIRGGVSRNALANANQARGWRIHADFAQHLIHVARGLHAADTRPGLNVDDIVYALDSSTIGVELFVETKNDDGFDVGAAKRDRSSANAERHVADVGQKRLVGIDSVALYA